VRLRKAEEDLKKNWSSRESKKGGGGETDPTRVVSSHVQSSAHHVLAKVQEMGGGGISQGLKGIGAKEAILSVCSFVPIKRPGGGHLRIGPAKSAVGV